MSFSEEAWKTIENKYKTIIEHPFNQELANGTLAKEKFQFYMKQDSLYLVEFARALAIAASKAPNPDDLVLLLDFSKGAIIAERGLHEFYFEHFGIQPDLPEQPNCFGYTNFLMNSVNHKTYEEGLAALLPCFWIYREVGLHIHKNSAAKNPYQKWVDTYSGDKFYKVVQDMIDLTDRSSQIVSPEIRKSMIQVFVHSTNLEWMFWDGAYNMKTWEH